ncbi:MAG: response regulator [Candidatus Omnitrophota bacterium]|jgi:two-component system chemotaxis response regulator CheY|nr:MAG: response regulator [Candidatus Omnitrophota bacterium]
MKALVVDDSALARTVLLNACSRVGIQSIDQAFDGKMALEYVTKNNYNIIFMDWNMPNMLGIEAVKKIREMGRNIPIIMVTGLSDRIHVSEAMKAGVNNYLIKPFKPETAIEKIQETLSATPS